MGRAGKNTHRNMLKSGRKDVQDNMPEPPKKKAVTSPPQMPAKKAPLMQYGNHPNC
jgi:hypothetical protein